MRTDELDFELPAELIAQTPAPRREQARMMVVRVAGEGVEHRLVADLPDLLDRGDLLVLNDTRVIPARFYGRRLQTGGQVEGLYLGLAAPDTWHAMLKSGGHPQPGERIGLDERHELELIEKEPDGSWRARLHGPLDTLTLLETIGVMPLPPYIQRGAEEIERFASLDRERYQTVYARDPGAIAAPTAGLHLTPELLDTLNGRSIETARLTLHVGAGTFAPVRTATLEEHAMHSERFTVPAATMRALVQARRDGRRIIPIGTTSVRALESLPENIDPAVAYSADTRLLIQPGFRFRFTDGLLTNFHLPRSTLLALVAAKVGIDRLKSLYRTAVEHRYRFYSYGDAMLILPE